MNSLERVGYVKIIEKHYVQEHFRVLIKPFKLVSASCFDDGAVSCFDDRAFSCFDDRAFSRVMRGH
jgi:hypothetical protein